MQFTYFSFGQQRIIQSTLENPTSKIPHFSVYHNIIDPNCVRSSIETREETHSVAASALHLCSMAVFLADVAALFEEDLASNATVAQGQTVRRHSSATQQEVSFVQGIGEQQCVLHSWPPSSLPEHTGNQHVFSSHTLRDQPSTKQSQAWKSSEVIFPSSLQTA